MIKKLKSFYSFSGTESKPKAATNCILPKPNSWSLARTPTTVKRIEHFAKVSIHTKLSKNVPKLSKVF